MLLHFVLRYAHGPNGFPVAQSPHAGGPYPGQDSVD